MKIFSAILFAFLVGCSSGPKVEVVLTGSDAVVTVYDAPCKNEVVKAAIDEQLAFMIMMGGDQEKLEAMANSFKQASVEVTDGETKGKKVEACAMKQESGESYYIIDAVGNQGPLAVKKS